MPCYEAPPEWSGDAQKSAENAVRILCAMISGAPNYTLVPRPVLAWYLAHRKVDLQIARDTRVIPKEDTERMVTHIEQDIAVIEHVLSQLEA